MRPDEHPDLVAKGKGNDTCQACVSTYFRGAPESICDGCKLNPMTTEEGAKQFLVDEFQRTNGFGVDELLEENRMLQPDPLQQVH